MQCGSYKSPCGGPTPSSSSPCSSRIFGVLAARRTPIDIFPNINIPVVSVVWTYNGLPPNDMSGRVIYYL